MAAEIHPTAVVHPGTVLGDGVKGIKKNAIAAWDKAHPDEAGEGSAGGGGGGGDDDDDDN